MIIFDLDQTLIDSQCVENYRNNGKWEKVYNNINEIKTYDGINELINIIYENKTPISIVTSSPESYSKRIVLLNKWPIKNIVSYHDTNKHKPFPDPILLAINNESIKTKQIYYIGDHENDIIAAKAAGVKSIAATWGSKNINQLTNSNPDKICNTVTELRNYLVKNRVIK